MPCAERELPANLSQWRGSLQALLVTTRQRSGCGCTGDGARVLATGVSRNIVIPTDSFVSSPVIQSSYPRCRIVRNEPGVCAEIKAMSHAVTPRSSRLEGFTVTSIVVVVVVVAAAVGCCKHLRVWSGLLLDPLQSCVFRTISFPAESIPESNMYHVLLPHHRRWFFSSCR